MSRLPYRRRAALVLHSVADLSAAEAAQVLGVTAQAVRNLTRGDGIVGECGRVLVLHR